MPKRVLKTDKKNPKDFLAEVVYEIDNSISDHTMKKLLASFESIDFDKNSKIVKEGEITNYLYFITKGIVRVYYHNSGKELIDWFAVEGMFFGNLYSHIMQKPGFDIYEAIEDVELLRINYNDLNRLFKESHQLESAGRKMMEKYYIKYVERVHLLKGLPADEKYQLFLENYASYANRIPLKFVANYLGITSETLSRIRTNVIKSKKNANN